jgi:putative ATPase
MDLFEHRIKEQRDQEAPLATRMRPDSLHVFVGQEHLVGKGHVLRTAIESGNIPSVILWGPPGSGKTTLAYIIANTTESYFASVSAVSAGVADLRRIIEEAKERRKLYQQKTILFIDEIHRFNKAQQDAVLPFVEDGTVTLIGATTENPSFEVNAPLLSRSRVLTLKPLTNDEIRIIILRALKDTINGLGRMKIEIEDEAILHLVVMSDHDARIALNTLELAVLATPPDSDGKRHVTLPTIEDALQQRALRYDKAGDQHYDLISALHKSMRGSDPDASLYWLARMLEAGEDPLYIARRLVRFASEDVGMADPQALVVAMASQQAVHFIGLPEGNLALAEIVVYLATAPKSNSLYTAYSAAQEEIKHGVDDPVPLHLRNPVTPLMREQGYGEGYRYDHDYPDHFADQQFLPEALQGRRFYVPGEQGYEEEVAARLQTWRPAVPEPGPVKIASSETGSVHVEFSCGEITLEGELHLPQGRGPFPVVVVCHPHSLYGGSMANNLVIAICEGLRRYAIAAFRFNFRGVGNSGGQFGGGTAEREDVTAALEFVSNDSNIDRERIGLAGYSFGGAVALPVAVKDNRVKRLALVSPALSESGWGQLVKYPQPKFIIVGSADSVIRMERYQQIASTARLPEEYRSILGADHFWQGFEDEVTAEVVSFFTSGFIDSE